MKKIVILPVRNEEWILDRCLAWTSLFADHIIVADQNSTDSTPGICKKYPKVVYIKNDTEAYNEDSRRQLLLNAARQFAGENFIANLSADEMFSANILKPGIFEKMVDGHKPGASFAYHWVQIWGSEHTYRQDSSVWSNNYMSFAFIDDRKTNFARDPLVYGLPRVPEALSRHPVRVENVKVLHYQMVNRERMLAKLRWARVNEFGNNLQRDRDFLIALKLNNKYGITKDEHGMRLKEVPQAWLEGYPDVPLNLKGNFWFAEPTLKLMRKIGLERLKWLDIWDTDWGKDFKDPRGFWQKFYHKHQRYLTYVYENAPRSIKKIFKNATQ